MSHFSHLDEEGRIRMVDVSDKPVTTRFARARGFVQASAETLDLIRQQRMAKGNPLEVARVAGILAGKNTAQIIPLCHPLGLTHLDVQCQLHSNGIAVEASATADGKTGVEMEALTAVAAAALTIYDMCKAVDKSMVINDICLLEKRGGRSGSYVRQEGSAPEG
ncbi:MAG: cyclic pyranopterin monophosphate synthase MoaC [Acidobacteriota bacterium]